jgi:predicted MFS family arabinose efflux permease
MTDVRYADDLHRAGAVHRPETSIDAPARRGGGVPARRLSPVAAFVLLASLPVSFLAASSAPTPLYAVYQAEWGFSPITTTVVFGVYAVAVLVALLTVGSLSDHIGRRPILIVAILVQAAVMLLYMTADSVPTLFLARVIQGLSTGAALGAVGAGLLDLHRARGAIANAVAPITGTATGALGSGLLVQFLPDPTQLVYVVLAALLVLQLVGVVLMAETSTPAPGALASLKPQFALPRAVRGPVLLAVPVLVAVWSLAGFYGALAPALVRLLSGSNSFVLGGLGLFVLAAAGGVTVLFLQGAQPRRMMMSGTAALAGGVAITLLAVTQQSTVGFFVGTAVAGMGFGAGFQGAIRTVLPLAAPHERSGVLSVVFVVSYLAMGLPAVVAGFLVVHGGGVVDTAREYCAAVIALAALALLGLARRPRVTT